MDSHGVATQDIGMFLNLVGFSDVRPKWCPPKVEFDWTSPKIKTGNWLKMRCKETCLMTHLPLDQVCAEHCMPSEFSQVKGLLNPLIYIPCSSFCRRDTLDIACFFAWLECHSNIPMFYMQLYLQTAISQFMGASHGQYTWAVIKTLDI